MPKPLPPLSTKLRRFADLLHQGHDQTSAYAKAGFTPHTSNASRAANRDDVRRYLEAKESRAAARALNDADAAVDRGEAPDFMEVARRAAAIAERRGDVKGMIRAAEIMKPRGTPGRPTNASIEAAPTIREQEMLDRPSFTIDPRNAALAAIDNRYAGMSEDEADDAFLEDMELIDAGNPRPSSEASIRAFGEADGMSEADIQRWVDVDRERAKTWTPTQPVQRPLVTDVLDQGLRDHLLAEALKAT